MAYITETKSYIEYVNHFKKTKLVASSYSDWDEKDSWFGGTKDLQETYDFAVNGWDAGLKLLEDDSDKIEVSGTVYTTNEIAGALVDVGGYLVGRPDNMLQFVDEVDRTKPDLTIYVDLAYSGHFHEDEAIKYTKTIINKVNELQVKYNLEIIGVFSLNGKGSRVTNLFINIKTYDQPLVLNSITFAFHPSFFRRFWHFYLNTLEEVATGGGAGLRDRGEVINEVNIYHTSNLYGGKEYWLLPSLQHHKGNMKETNYDKFRL